MVSELATKSKHKTKMYNNRSKKITKVTIHHMAGYMSAEACAKMWVDSKRAVSANYIIGRDGEIISFLDEDKRSWASSSRDNDQQAITIEVSNDCYKHPWTISDKVLESLVKLCADICTRYQITPNYTGDKEGSFTFHRMFTQTECPGFYIASNINNIIDRIKKQMQGDTSCTFKKYKVTASALNVRSGASTKYPKIATLKKDTLIEVCNTCGTWAEVVEPAGWVSMKYIKEV